jgi:hypothetical protein
MTEKEQKNRTELRLTKNKQKCGEKQMQDAQNVITQLQGLSAMGVLFSSHAHGVLLRKLLHITSPTTFPWKSYGCANRATNNGTKK